MNKKRKDTGGTIIIKNNSDIKEEKNNNSYFAKGRRKRKQYMKIIIPAIVGIIAITEINYSLLFPTRNDVCSDVRDILGSAHEHAAFMVDLNGTKIDFAQQKYMVKDPTIYIWKVIMRNFRWNNPTQTCYQGANRRVRKEP